MDFVLSAGMATLGVLTILNLGKFSISTLPEIFLAGYMIVFAVLLFTYELMWWMAIPAINKSLRKNFGFLYGLKGKGFYLIFAAFLTIGLARDKNARLYTYIAGGSYIAGGIFHLMVGFCNPDVSDRYAAPSAGISNV